MTEDTKKPQQEESQGSLGDNVDLIVAQNNIPSTFSGFKKQVEKKKEAERNQIVNTNPAKESKKKEQALVREKFSGDEIYDFVRRDLAKELTYNKLTNEVEWNGEVLSGDTIQAWVLKHLNVYCSGKDTLWQAVLFEALERSYHPVVKYLEGLKEKPVSIDDLSTRYFGNNSSLANTVIKRTLIGAVARAYDPGCKMDNILLLYGKQGIGKSTFFNILAGEWFDDSVTSLVNGNKDELIKLHRCWIQELAESERLIRKNSAEVKAMISSRSDLFRLPYSRDTKEHKRSFILVGSTNNDDLLHDATGNRRSWVVEVITNKIDTVLLKQERNAIWAAAVAAYKNGEQWWLTDLEEAQNNINNQKYESKDAWIDLIESYCRENPLTRYFSIGDIGMNALGVEPGRLDRRTQMRIADLMTKLGFEGKKKITINGKRLNVRQSPFYTGMPDKSELPF